MPEDLLFAFEPNSHLRVLITVIGCAVRVLCQINVKALRIFSVVVVRCAEQLNGLDIVNQRVEFGKVEVLANTELDKDMFVGMEITEGLMEEPQGFRGMYWVLCEIEKVQESSGRPDEGNRGCAVREIHVNDEAKENPAHVGVFFSSKAGK